MRLVLSFGVSLALHACLCLGNYLPTPDSPLKSTIRATWRVLPSRAPQPVPTEPPPAFAAIPATPAETNPAAPDPAFPKKPEPDQPTAGELVALAPRKTAPDPEKTAEDLLRCEQGEANQTAFYPCEARARGVEGDVHLLLAFSDDGTVSNADILSSSGDASLDRAAVKAAYAYGTRLGTIESDRILTIRFQLKD